MHDSTSSAVQSGRVLLVLLQMNHIDIVINCSRRDEKQRKNSFFWLELFVL